MALTESRLRQIIKEEARRTLRESTGKVATMDAVARALRNMENPEADDLADKIERYNRSHGGTTSIEFDERDDGTVKAYEREGSRTGNYMFDIPDDIYKGLRSSLSDRLSERRRPATGSRISESRVKQIILEETRRARRALREGDEYDDEEPDYDAMNVGPVPTSALVKRVAPNEYDLEFAEEFGGGEDDGDAFEDEGMTPESVIDRYKDEGPRSWMRVSNDFREMADGGMEDIREKYYPGLTTDDCAMIADELDSHFGMG